MRDYVSATPLSKWLPPVFILHGINPTGKEIGCGAYGRVQFRSQLRLKEHFVQPRRYPDKLLLQSWLMHEARDLKRSKMTFLTSLKSGVRSVTRASFSFQVASVRGPTPTQ